MRRSSRREHHIFVFNPLVYQQSKANSFKGKGTKVKILVIGGTGFIGREITEQAVAAGHEVTVFHRGKTPLDHQGLTSITGDVDSIVEQKDDLRAQKFEAVIHGIAYTEKHGHDLRQVFAGTGVRLVVLSSVDCYEAWQGLNRLKDLSELPITEQSETSRKTYYWDDTETKGAHRHTYDKNLLTDVIMAGDQAGEYGATVFRLPLVWGPRDHQMAGRHGDFIQRILAGRHTAVLSDRQQCQVYTYGYVTNLAAAIIHSLLLPQCAGKIYNLGERHSRSRRRWLELFGKVLDWPFEVHVLPEELLRDDRRYRNAPPQHLLIHSELFYTDTAFHDPVTLTDAIKATFAYAKAHRASLGDPLDFQKEDDLIRRYGAAMEGLLA